MTQKAECERGYGGSAELIGVLSAISIVSRRLAGRIAALERKEAKPERAGIPSGDDRDTHHAAALCGRAPGV